jgi:hypothetical protein
VAKVRGCSGGRFTSSLRHDLTGAWLDHHPLPHITLYDPRPLGRAASQRTPCVKSRRAVDPNHRSGGERRAMVYYYMVCDHSRAEGHWRYDVPMGPRWTARGPAVSRLAR